jgi:predicted secreted hydrolase
LAYIWDMIGFKKLLILLFLVFLLIIRPVLAKDTNGYLSVTGPCNLEFPRDHGPHPGYRTEWWYYTGNLKADIGDRYGFQLTFFRSQISPSGAKKKWPNPPSAWRTQQIYLGHAAVVDISAKRQFQAEQVARNALGMAGASQESGVSTIFIKNWLAQIGPHSHILKAQTDKFSYELTLKAAKPPVAHGLAGYSRKGSTPERASCYYSFTRLICEGNLTVGGKTIRVHGLSWMDHEFTTAPLEPAITGWDWFSLQLSDQTEVMIFLLRKEGGGLNPASSGTFVDASGKTRHLKKDEFEIDVQDEWTSPKSHAVYPARWQLTIFPLSVEINILPNLSDQELQTTESTGVTYWEGSVSIEGTRNGAPIEGAGYVELTGYAKPFDASM